MIHLKKDFKIMYHFLLTNNRYKSLIGVSNPIEAIEIMSKTGYATDSKYKQKLLAIYRLIQSVDN